MDSSISPSTLSPPAVPMELHLENREKLFNSFRDHLSQLGRTKSGFVCLQGGEEQTRHCTDHIELFRQESYFAYLFGVVEPGFYGAIDMASGESILFAPRLPADYAVWLGEIKPLSHFKDKYMVHFVYYTDEITKVLQQQHRGPEKPLLYLLHGLNTDSNNFSRPAHFEGIENFKTDLNALHPILTECRVLKTQKEIALIQFANDISSEAHVEVMRKTKVGMKEYQLESLFLHHTYMYGGCRHCSYTCICATGDNSAILHYGHAAAPNDRTLEDGDMALFDMGAEYHFYGSDITCSFPVNGKFTEDQSLVYNAVLSAHDAVISNMRPGVNWVDMHKASGGSADPLPPPPTSAFCFKTTIPPSASLSSSSSTPLHFKSHCCNTYFNLVSFRAARASSNQHPFLPWQITLHIDGKQRSWEPLTLDSDRGKTGEISPGESTSNRTIFVGSADNSNSQQVTINRLTEKNYMEWAQSVLLVLNGNGKFGYLTGEISKPVTGDPTEKSWKAENSLLIA